MSFEFYSNTFHILAKITRMKQSFILLSLALAMYSCKKPREVTYRYGEPDVVNVSTDDADMNAAIKEAQNTYPDFLKVWRSDNPKYEGFTVKQEFETATGGGEHIWLTDLFEKGNDVYGILANEPLDKVRVKLGDTIKIDPKMLSDWMYFEGDKTYGGFTVRVLRKDLSEEERKQEEKESGIKFED